MLKRMVRHAAENGYDQLAWTPGDVQADRYDLSKQAETSFTTTKVQRDLTGIRQGQRFTASSTRVKLRDPRPASRTIIGKDAADEQLNNPAAKKAAWRHHRSTETILTGQDLKVGGEGMRAFYDKMLVDKANAIGKKYGARVTQGLDIDRCRRPTGR